MVEKARHLNPEIEFIQGDMTKLEMKDESFGGIAAFYSIIYIPRENVTQAFREQLRLLYPEGWLQLDSH